MENKIAKTELPWGSMAKSYQHSIIFDLWQTFLLCFSLMPNWHENWLLSIDRATGQWLLTGPMVNSGFNQTVVLSTDQFNFCVLTKVQFFQ